jgi:hypothetical protein
MAEWEDRARRGLGLLDSSTDEQNHTICMLNKILDSGNRDDFVSRDYYNVQQTAGGLPPDKTLDWFLGQILGHIRGGDPPDYGIMSSSFAPEVSDDDFRSAILSFDNMIRTHIRFLNGVVHQAAPGDVHVALWNWILDQLKDDTSLYACYRDYLKDDR